ncbi:ABC transporter substrate-binding protein [Salipaludibacillus agaradhaerens]|uniref:ABC transporter substrate-binding protein n=1 Tax=Salipaludibacillus agaradhaerens TaxID=76935 RepID=UPI000996D134|nr:ABC transporter substrate-binding protein [Salipaludibacillus agaradhaerens]
MMKKVILFPLSLLFIVVLASCNSADTRHETSTDTNNEDVTTDERLITHEGGETTIVGTPEKIAVLDYRLADTLIALDIRPHAMTTYLGETNLPYIENTSLEGIVPLGDDVNIEALLEAKPDLIIARTSEEGIYDSLSKIAPTILLSAPDDWRDSFKEVAAIVDKEEKAEEWLKDYDEKAEALRTKLEENIEADETFLYLRVMPKEIRVHGTDFNLSATLFHDLELTPVEGLENLDKVETISLEALTTYDADHIFLENGGPNAVDDPEAEEQLNTLMESAIWNSLTAVENDQVYFMPPWVISDYPNIKNKSLDLIEEALIE